MRIYLAGPEVFLPNAVEIGDSKKAICQKYGFEGVTPFDSGADLSGDKYTVACNISKANEGLIKSCAILIANMSPFRGPSMDVGTAFEMGFARAAGLRVMGYTCSPHFYSERMCRALGPFPSKNEGGDYLDEDGMFVENFDMHDNLMIDGAIVASGAEVVWMVAEGKGRWNRLDAFEECVAQAANRFIAEPQ